MDDAKKGEWVRVHRIILSQDQRAAKLPEETRLVPLDMWVGGVLLDEKASIGDSVTVRTITNRIVEGRLESVQPSYHHSFGSFVPELQAIRQELRNLMTEGE